MQVNISKLKAGLSRYVASARAGEVVEITLHAKPVARLVGISQAAAGGIAELISQGAATWSNGRPTFAPMPLTQGGKTLSDILSEDRG
ncbi:MAG: type II toxin-antitoxin system prevent-host-death family antitoxin [Ideonella sp.]